MIVVSHRLYGYKTEKELVMPTVDPNAVILTGENPFIRLSATDGSPNTTEASFWRITFSPGGTRARALSEERAHGGATAHLCRQYWHDPLVAIDGARHAQYGNGRPRDSRH